MTFAQINEILAREQLPVIQEVDYNIINTAILRSEVILFDYLDKENISWRYRRVRPVNYFTARKVYLNAWHDLHASNHTFRAWAISNVATLGNIIDAIIDMDRYREFWDGSSMALETTLI